MKPNPPPRPVSPTPRLPLAAWPARERAKVSELIALLLIAPAGNETSATAAAAPEMF